MQAADNVNQESLVGLRWSTPNLPPSAQGNIDAAPQEYRGPHVILQTDYEKADPPSDWT